MSRPAVRLLVLPFVLVLAGCGGAADDQEASSAPGAGTTAGPTTQDATSSAAAAPATDLRIEVWPEGRASGGSTTVRLTCDPPGGDAPDPAAACAALAAQDEPFAPLPADLACTEIYGGPEEAHVTGTHRGAPVDERFSRTNGCQIARWDGVVAALGAPGG